MRSRLTLCVIARLFCVAVSDVVSLRDFSCEASHALCRCEIYLRSGLPRCVIARFFCGAISCIVSLRDLFAEHLTRCVVARFICEAVLRFLSLRDFSCGAVLRVASLRGLFAEQSHDLCRCEIFLRSDFTLCVIARFFA